MSFIWFGIFINIMSINFLLQAVRIIHVGNYDDTEIRMIYDYLKNLDNFTLNDYFNRNSILTYNNDLEFCIEIIDKMIKIFETDENDRKVILRKISIEHPSVRTSKQKK